MLMHPPVTKGSWFRVTVNGGHYFKPSVKGEDGENAKYFFSDGMGFSLCNYFSLINLLVVCAILYILNYNASPQSIL